MNIICLDMDNTLIYSYKKDIGNKKLNVEIYEEREISFISEKTYALLQKVKDRMLIVPTSTRTEEQYGRIDLKIGTLKYALVCNGGVLLIDGKRDKEWYDESIRLIEKSVPELEKAMNILDRDCRRKFELRFIDRLFIFTKCDESHQVVNDLRLKLDTEKVDVFNNGEKVYVVPKNLSKGMAVKRIREKLNPEIVIAAGDSEFDITMVEEADVGLVPYGFTKKYKTTKKLIEKDNKTLFSELLLEESIKINDSGFPHDKWFRE